MVGVERLGRGFVKEVVIYCYYLITVMTSELITSKECEGNPNHPLPGKERNDPPRHRDRND